MDAMKGPELLNFNMRGTGRLVRDRATSEVGENSSLSARVEGTCGFVEHMVSKVRSDPWRNSVLIAYNRADGMGSAPPTILLGHIVNGSLVVLRVRGTPQVFRPQSAALARVGASAAKEGDEGNKRKRAANRSTISASRSSMKAPAVRSRTGRAVIKPTLDGEESSDEEDGKTDAEFVSRSHMLGRHDALLARLDRAEVGIGIRCLQYGSSVARNGELYAAVACEETLDLLILSENHR